MATIAILLLSTNKRKEKMKTLNEISLYDVMAEDVDVWIGKNKDFGYTLQIEDEKGAPLVDEKGIHPYAVDAFADFCRSFLHSYDRINSKEVA
jgi:hypothetical protein